MNPPLEFALGDGINTDILRETMDLGKLICTRFTVHYSLAQDFADPDKGLPLSYSIRIYSLQLDAYWYWKCLLLRLECILRRNLCWCG